MQRRATSYTILALLILVWTTLPLGAQSVDYEPYARVLSDYVNGTGLVDYEALKANDGDLRAFNRQLGRLTEETYSAMTDDEKIALLTNAYNSFTLAAIIDHYPIEASGFSAFIYPDNSIRQINGVWKELTFRLMGKGVTLDQIEHEILRKDFKEPRIHMALVCAARGCPILRDEPYTGDQLDAQFDEQAERFLARPDGFRLDRDARTVYLTSIFKWFGEDFVGVYSDDRLKDYGKTDAAVLAFVSQYVEDSEAAFIRANRCKIRYTDYDWRLNEQ